MPDDILFWLNVMLDRH